jgi:hypothetical protein
MHLPHLTSMWQRWIEEEESSRRSRGAAATEEEEEACECSRAAVVAEEA